MNLAWLLHRSGGVHGARPAAALGEQVLLTYGELSHPETHDAPVYRRRRRHNSLDA